MGYIPFWGPFVDHRRPTIWTRQTFNHFAIASLSGQLVQQLAHQRSPPRRDLPRYLINTGLWMFRSPLA
jgi:hypothetical protein